MAFLQRMKNEISKEFSKKIIFVNPTKKRKSKNAWEEKLRGLFIREKIVLGALRQLRMPAFLVKIYRVQTVENLAFQKGREDLQY